jgi:hypothetical protein
MTADDSSRQHDGELARTTTIVLAEFGGLRSEIATRISLLVTLILGNLSVLGVVLGIALSHPGNLNVLLLLPLVTPCIGMLVIDSFRNLDMLGRYIYGVIRPQLQIKSQLKFEGAELFDWERRASKHHFTPWVGGLFQLVLSLEFLGPPIAVLVYAINYHLQHSHVQVSTLQRWLWWTGAVLTGVLILYAVGYGSYSAWHSRGSKKMRSSAREPEETEAHSGGATDDPAIGQEHDQSAAAASDTDRIVGR